MKPQRITPEEVQQWLKNPAINTGLALLQRIRPNIKVHTLEAVAAKLRHFAGIQQATSPITHHPSPPRKLSGHHATPPRKLSGHHPSPFIEQIVKEHSRLVSLRSMLDEQRKALGTANDAATVKQRKTLTASIQQHSQRIEMLYNAKEDYYNKNIIPDMVALGLQQPDETSQPKATDPKLSVRLKSLRDMQTRDQNLLDYQQTSKAPEPNPMPDGKKRFSIIARMEKRLIEIKKLSNE